MKLERIIKKYFSNSGAPKFRLVKEPNKSFSLIYPKCKVNLYHNRNYRSIECYIENRDSGEKYTLKAVLQANDVEHQDLGDDYSNMTIEEFVAQYAEKIGVSLLHVINGDFRWEAKLIEINVNIKLIQDRLDSFFIADHPAYDKMIKGDENWKDYLP